MRCFAFYFLLVLTALCCVPFAAMSILYLSWRQAGVIPTGPDIGLGLVMLTGAIAAVAILPWVIYGGIIGLQSNWTIAGPYFSGWRRKTGLILLAVSCLLCMGMVRSFYVTDGLNAFGGRFESQNGSIERSVQHKIVIGSIGGSTVSPSWNLPYLSILAPVALAACWLLLVPQPKPVTNG